MSASADSLSGSGVALEDIFAHLCSLDVDFKTLCHRYSVVAVDMFSECLNAPCTNLLMEWVDTVSSIRYPCTKKVLSQVYILTHEFFCTTNQPRFDQLWANVMLSSARFAFGYDLAEIDPSIPQVKTRLVLAVLYVMYELACDRVRRAKTALNGRARTGVDRGSRSIYEILAVLMRVMNSINRRCNVYMASQLTGQSEDDLSRESMQRFEQSLQRERDRLDDAEQEQKQKRLEEARARRAKLLRTRSCSKSAVAASALVGKVQLVSSSTSMSRAPSVTDLSSTVMSTCSSLADFSLQDFSFADELDRHYSSTSETADDDSPAVLIE